MITRTNHKKWSLSLFGPTLLLALLIALPPSGFAGQGNAGEKGSGNGKGGGTAVETVVTTDEAWTAGTTADAAADGRFTCRASALRIDNLLATTLEPVVSNPAEDPCATDNDVLLGLNALGINLGVLVTDTENTQTAIASDALAVGANILGLVSVGVLESSAGMESIGGECVPVAKSSVASLTLQGLLQNGGLAITQPIDIELLNLLGLRIATLHLNHTIEEPTRVIQRALWLEITNDLLRTLTGLKDVVIGEAIADFEGGNPCAEPEPPTPTEDTARMTGGGKFTSGLTAVTHGFVLHCDASRTPNNLEINWGNGNKFHLESLGSSACSDNPGISEGQPVAGFDTLTGTGTGRYNGVSGATAEWTFTDAGEPGRNDTARILIKDNLGRTVLNVSGKLASGNQQAHGN